MIARLLKIFLFVAVIAYLILRLFNRKQKQALHEAAKIAAAVCMVAAIIGLLWYWFLSVQ